MKKFKTIYIIFISVLMLSFPHMILAAVVGTPTDQTPPVTTIGAKIENPFKGGDDLMTLIRTILSDIVMPIAAVAIVCWIIWAGFQLVLAQGKPGDIDKAKENLLWSLVGAGILLGAVGISAVVEATIKALIK